MQGRTLGGLRTSINASQAFFKLCLRAVKLLKGRCQVVQLLVELLLDLSELLRFEGVEIDCFAKEC